MAGGDGKTRPKKDKTTKETTKHNEKKKKSTKK